MRMFRYFDWPIEMAPVLAPLLSSVIFSGTPCKFSQRIEADYSGVNPATSVAWMPIRTMYSTAPKYRPDD